jgi:RNA polymerase sigma factor (sigma-70 family)
VTAEFGSDAEFPMSATATPPTSESDPVTDAVADPAVWRQMTNAARAALGRRAFSLTRAQCAAEAEEVMARARERALSIRARYDPAQPVVPWLMGIVSKVTSEFVKKRGRDPTGPPPPSAPQLDELAVDLRASDADALADAELVEHLLAPLSPDDRELIRLKYTDDLTFAEIAAQVGSNENALRVRLHRLIGRLREACKTLGEVLP